jgi:hypothetical protein
MSTKISAGQTRSTFPAIQTCTDCFETETYRRHLERSIFSCVPLLTRFPSPYASGMRLAESIAIGRSLTLEEQG